MMCLLLKPCDINGVDPEYSLFDCNNIWRSWYLCADVDNKGTRVALRNLKAIPQDFCNGYFNSGKKTFINSLTF